MTARKPISPTELNRILALRSAGWPINKIARRVRRMNSFITDVLKAAGRPPPRGGSSRGVPRDPKLLMKSCSKCKLDLPLLTEFYGNRTRPNGRAEQCRECQKDRQSDLREAKRCGKAPASSVKPTEQIYLPHEFHRIDDPVLRSEVEAKYLSILAPRPLYFSDGRRMDD